MKRHVTSVVAAVLLVLTASQGASGTTSKLTRPSSTEPSTELMA